MDPSWLEYIRDGGMITLLFIILYGGYKKWWVFGWAYRQKEEEAERWMRAALKSTDLSERLVEISEEKVRK